MEESSGTMPVSLATTYDVAWPLFLLSRGGFSAQYLETEGAEFETGDRYGPEIAAAGGQDLWLRAVDADPRR